MRHAEIIPRLPGATAEGAEAVGPKAVLARWRLGDGARLTIACNFADAPAAVTATGRLLHETAPGAATTLAAGTIPPRTTVALLDIA
ncbi:DUF3459 domain-containing protein [Roseomonas sp. CCTCC AB2023176]|uniref:DUF3459 domain-containing protein n=1 Tax=Roseomonas sp. CCTCC AB2023176 TaxID=3342640 RepID=UPI0035DCCA2A